MYRYLPTLDTLAASSMWLFISVLLRVSDAWFAVIYPMPPMSAANWYMSSMPSVAWRQPSKWRRSATTNSSAGLSSNSGCFMSTARTQCPSDFRRLTR